jgi:hypothetical protein
MKRLVSCFVVAGLVGCASSSEMSKTPEMAAEVTPPVVSELRVDGEKGAEDILTATVTAKVRKLDQKSRMITLKGPEGNEVTFKVSDAVKRLKEVKVGDDVVVEYIQSIAYEVREPTAAEKKKPTTSFEVMEKAGPDAPPGVGMLRSVHTIVKVVGLDRSANTVTLKLPKGEISTVKAKYPDRLEKIKVGDTIAISYTEGVAVSIEPMGDA